MKNIIAIDEVGKITARGLYEFLELTKGQFARWANQHILGNQYAEEHVDYEGFDIVVEGNTTVDFKLTTDFAKKLCMVSKSEKGEQARKYFIEVEKSFNSIKMSVPKDYASALRELAATWEREQETLKTLEIAKPKIEFFDAVADSKDAVPMNEVSKVLAVKGMGRNNLFEFLRENKILMNNNIPYQKYVDLNYFRVVEQKYTRNAEECITFKTLVYQKGLAFINNLLKKGGQAT